MPFAGISPESLLSRNDSKNPATTCKGITANGRPCRRALAASPLASPTPSPLRGSRTRNGHSSGMLAVLTADDHDGNRAAAFYCWQHKEQAQQMAAEKTNHTHVVPLTKRSSIDTIVDRLGILELDEKGSHRHMRKTRRHRDDPAHIRRRDTLPEAWQDVPGPLITVPESALETPVHIPSPPRPPPRPSAAGRQHQPQSNVKASILCCVRAVDDDAYPPPRQHRPSRVPAAATRPNPTPPVTTLTSKPPEMTQRPARPGVPTRPSNPNSFSPSAHLHAQQRPPTHHLSPPPPPPLTRHPSSQTQTLLSYIPTSLSPQTTSLLLQELSRPISAADESGYIYIFWLTPPSTRAPRPDDETASNLFLSVPPSSSSSAAAAAAVAAPTRRPDTSHRRGSDALRTFADASTTASTSSSSHLTASTAGAKTVLLKIGRASNVHRRLNQWTRQCGYNVTLMRYYPPYQHQQQHNASSSSSPSSSPQTSRQVPHVHRVERLIHIELSERRAKDLGTCGRCGREHREWFRVEASRGGLRDVDGVVRRWVGWAEGLAGQRNA